MIMDSNTNYSTIVMALFVISMMKIDGISFGNDASKISILPGTGEVLLL